MSTLELSRGVEHIHTADFHQKVLQSEIPVLVDFYADWCGPCKALAPLLEEFAGETAHTKVVKVNVDDNPELADHFHVESIPSLLVFKDGHLVARHRGMANKQILSRLVASEPKSL